MRVAAVVLSFISLFSSMTADLFETHDPDAITRLVNRQNTLEYTYEPPELVMPAVEAAPGKEKNIYMRGEAATALEQLFAEAGRAGHVLYAVSGYRSYNTQRAIFERKVDSVGEEQAMLTVAPPGASEHQLGLAMDINGETTVKKGLVQEFGETPEGLWVAENAHQFGFIVRYQKGMTSITGYAWEPWHLRYVGPEIAAEVYEQDITFEEYHENRQKERSKTWVMD